MNTEVEMTERKQINEGGPPTEVMTDGPADGFHFMNHVCTPVATVLCCPLVCLCSWKQINEKTELVRSNVFVKNSNRVSLFDFMVSFQVILRWGRYEQTIREPGCRWVNCIGLTEYKVSTALLSLDLPNQKMVDGNGNPLIVSGIVTYKVADSFKAQISVVSCQSLTES